MPDYWNLPIIGDSLSDATRQYGDWQRVGMQNVAANDASRVAAQQYWNSQVAQRDQEAFRRQELEDQRQLNQEAIGREQYRWETNRRDAAARDALTATLEREKIAAQTGTSARNETRALQEQDNAAENLAQPIAETGARLDAAQADWDAKTTALNTAVARITDQYPGLIKFDQTKGIKTFKPIKQADDKGDKAAQAAAFKANAQAAEVFDAHMLAENALKSVQNEFKVHQQKLGPNLTFAKRDGRYVVVNLLGKPGENEHRWVPPAIVGPPRPLPAPLTGFIPGRPRISTLTPPTGRPATGDTYEQFMDFLHGGQEHQNIHYPGLYTPPAPSSTWSPAAPPVGATIPQSGGRIIHQDDNVTVEEL